VALFKEAGVIINFIAFEEQAAHRIKRWFIFIAVEFMNHVDDRAIEAAQ
jgi:hypothetical protein